MKCILDAMKLECNLSAINGNKYIHFYDFYGQKVNYY
jgi:hypothetical protein